MNAASLPIALVAARRAAGLTQRELAWRLGRARSYVGKIERGRRQVTVPEFCEFAIALGVDPPTLLTTVLTPAARAGASEQFNDSTGGDHA